MPQDDPGGDWQTDKSGATHWKARMSPRCEEEAAGKRTTYTPRCWPRPLCSWSSATPSENAQPHLVLADVIREDVQRDLLGEDMTTTESGELGDAHTATPPTADPAAVK